MIFIFGILTLFVASCAARATPKIEIFEIRESRNGLELKNLNTNSRNHQNSDSLLKLLRNPRNDDQATKLAKQLLSKLKSLRGDEKSNRYYGDDAHIYILNSDILDDESSYEESFFIDKTRNDKTSDIRDVLLQLFQPERKLSSLKRKKLRQAFKRPTALRSDDRLSPLRSDDPVEDRSEVTSASPIQRQVPPRSTPNRAIPGHRNKYDNDEKDSGSDK